MHKILNLFPEFSDFKTLWVILELLNYFYLVTTPPPKDAKFDFAAMPMNKTGEMQHSPSAARTNRPPPPPRLNAENIKISTDLNYINVAAIRQSNNGNVTIESLIQWMVIQSIME